jgi:hypothetical protein
MNIINGTYVKDFNNALGDYIGTWRATWQGKILSLKIEKVTKQIESTPNQNYHYRDILIGKYLITDAVSGAVIASSMNIVNPNLDKLYGIGSGQNNKYQFSYTDTDLCNITGKVILSRNLANNNQLTYEYEYNEFWLFDDCPYHTQGFIPIPIPTIEVVLTKI